MSASELSRGSAVVPREAVVAATALLWDKRGMLPEHSEEIIEDVLKVALPIVREAADESFVAWLEAWCSGYIARREGLPDTDGEAFMRAAREAFDGSGAERARRLIESGDSAAIAEALGRLAR